MWGSHRVTGWDYEDDGDMEGWFSRNIPGSVRGSSWDCFYLMNLGVLILRTWFQIYIYIYIVFLSVYSETHFKLILSQLLFILMFLNMVLCFALLQITCSLSLSLTPLSHFFSLQIVSQYLRLLQLSSYSLWLSCRSLSRILGWYFSCYLAMCICSNFSNSSVIP